MSTGGRGGLGERPRWRVRMPWMGPPVRRRPPSPRGSPMEEAPRRRPHHPPPPPFIPTSSLLAAVNQGGYPAFLLFCPPPSFYFFLSPPSYPAAPALLFSRSFGPSTRRPPRAVTRPFKIGRLLAAPLAPGPTVRPEESNRAQKVKTEPTTLTAPPHLPPPTRIHPGGHPPSLLAFRRSSLLCPSCPINPSRRIFWNATGRPLETVTRIYRWDLAVFRPHVATPHRPSPFPINSTL